MFNSGEITLMQEVGMSPVFFAQTLSGPKMPNLVYMVSGENPEEHRKHWQGFINSPVWKKLSSDPQYKDNMTDKGVINVFLSALQPHRFEGGWGGDLLERQVANERVV